MSHSTLTSKGQTTIPLDVRKALGLLPGMKIAFDIRDGEAVLRPLLGGRRLAGMLGAGIKRSVDFAEAREAATKSWATAAAKEGLDSDA